MPIDPAACVLLSTLDTRISLASAGLDARQASFLGRGKGYFQGIRTPSILPADGLFSLINASAHPTDQREDWTDFGVAFIGGSLQMSIQFDVYQGPEGRGYSLRTLVLSGSQAWHRTRHAGPEAYREMGWTCVLASEASGLGDRT